MTAAPCAQADASRKELPRIGDKAEAALKPPSPGEVQLLEVARRYLRQRRARQQLFGVDLFGDAAWDIMLDLYCARLARAEVSVMDACIAAGVPTTTGIRFIKQLGQAGIISRRRDSHDGRRSWVELTNAAAAQVESWLRGTFSIAAACD